MTGNLFDMKSCKILTLLAISSATLAHCTGHAGRTSNVNATLGTFLHNRISPNYSELYIARADGSDERLLLGDDSVFDFRASWSSDGSYVTFTSERRGDGQADIYRAPTNGSGAVFATPELLVASDGVDDAGEVAPDGKTLAFTTSRFNQTSNIMLMDLATRESRNLTLIDGIAGAANPTQPNGYFKPTWSPDGEWVVFTSDRNTPWRGHSDGAGWEHVQELSIYAVRPNGTDFRLVSSRANYTQGSPRFSPDGKRLVFYEMLTEDTYNARLQPALLYNAALNTSIVSVDFATGTGRVVHASGIGVKLSPSYVTSDVCQCSQLIPDCFYILMYENVALGYWLRYEGVIQQRHLLRIRHWQELHTVPDYSNEHDDAGTALPCLVARRPVRDI